MISTVRVSKLGVRTVFASLGLIAMLCSSTQANPWSRALGDARSVQNRTKDIAERLNREFPYSQVTTVALRMDNAACQLVDAVKCGASWGQVQASLAGTCALATQVNALVNADCHVRNDRRTRDYVNDLAKRVERLRCNLDKALAATQPKFCLPPVIANHPSWGSSYQPEPFLAHPNAGPSPQYGSEPFHSSSREERYQEQFSYPRDTYEFDAPRFDESPIPFGGSLDPFPLGRPVGPIEYRVERNAPTNTPRAAAFVQLGLQAIRLLAQD